MLKSRFVAFLCLAAVPLAVFCAGLCPLTWAEEDPTTDPAARGTEAKDDAKPKAVEIGQKLPALTIKDDSGKALDLHDCGITKKDAEGVLMATARKFGAPEGANAETKISDLKGVKDGDGDLDTALVKDLVCTAGTYFGLTATEDTVERFKTLGDITNWIAKANDAPILLVTWSPNCPSIKKSNDRIVEVAAQTDVRIFALACNSRDNDEHTVKFKEIFDFNVRVFPDRDQKVTDILGGKTTPHFFLLDKDAVLRYKGALDNDPMGYMDDEERDDYIADAVAAIRAGKEVETKQTEPAG